MGFLDKMKSAGQAMTGGSARVSIEFAHSQLKPGDSLPVKVTVVSMGKEVKSSGVFVDIHAEETGNIRCKHCGHEYGANGGDIFERKCPKCQDGRPGLPY